MTTLAEPMRSVDVGGPDRGTASTAGMWQLLRLIARRDRFRIVLWLGGIVGLVVATAASITGLYTTQADLDRYAGLVRGNAALIVQSGPGYGLQDPAAPATTGAVVMNELAIWTIIAVALMSVFMTVRHTRTEEETERAEIVRALPVGRHSQLTAALVGVLATNVVVAGGVVVALVSYDLPVAGSVAFGLALVGAGSVFAAVAAVAAQVAGGSRAALGLGGVVLGASFVLRAVGDVGNGPLSWLSPIGWAQAIRAFADERWWVLLLPVVAAAGLLSAAFELQARRDLGAGLLPEQPGPPTASAAPVHAARPRRAATTWVGDLVDRRGRALRVPLRRRGRSGGVDPRGQPGDGGLLRAAGRGIDHRCLPLDGDPDPGVVGHRFHGRVGAACAVRRGCRSCRIAVGDRHISGAVGGKPCGRGGRRFHGDDVDRRCLSGVRARRHVG